MAKTTRDYEQQRPRPLYDRVGYRDRGNGWFSGERARAGEEPLGRRTQPVAEVLVDEFEAARGTTLRFDVTRTESCDACEGDGAAPRAASMPCPGCGGSGRRRVEDPRARGEWLFPIEDCRTCGGRGRIVSDPCPACGGAGVTEFDEPTEVDIPPGCRDGDRVPLSNGDPGEVVVRVLAASPERALVRYLAVAGLLVALGCLWLLLR